MENRVSDKTEVQDRQRFKHEIGARVGVFSNSCHEEGSGRFCETHGVVHGEGRTLLLNAMKRYGRKITGSENQDKHLDADGKTIDAEPDPVKKRNLIRDLSATYEPGATPISAPDKINSTETSTNDKLLAEARKYGTPLTSAVFIKTSGRGNYDKGRDDRLMTQKEFNDIRGTGMKNPADDHPMTQREFIEVTGRGNAKKASNDHPMTAREFIEATGRGGARNAPNDHPMTEEEYRKAMGMGKR